MVQTVGIAEAQALLARGDIELIDVRSADEWSAGHLPGARNVPLEAVQADPKGRLKTSRVLFVCARGMRSLKAAASADEAGIKEVFSLDGGTSAWASAGLPIETPTAPKPDLVVDDASCGLPEPGLDAVVGQNLKELRAQKGLSLDQLAQATGLSRTLLGQIELGKTAPSVSVVWRIAKAFDVHFSALLASSAPMSTSVMRGATAKRLVSPDGRFSSRALYALAEKPDVEFYELFLAAHSKEEAQPHQPGTRENLIVTAGRLELNFGGERHELAKGDAIVFSADVPHSYVNPGNDECWMYLVMTYANRGQ